MKYPVRIPVACSAAALGLALAAPVSAARAQEVITREIVGQPVETVVTQPGAAVVAAQPLVTVPTGTETVRTTTRTVRTLRPTARRTARRQVITTQTVTQRIVPAPTIVARTMSATPQPLYDEVTSAPLATTAPTYSPPLYDTVVAPAAPLPIAATTVAPDGSAIATAPYIYRYIYEPDRILVVDPNTGVAIQAIPR